MKHLSELLAAVFAKAGSDQSTKKGLPLTYRADEARADEMEDLPPHMRAEAMREVERAIHLCESPIEQVALYQLAGCNYGNEEYPVRARVLLQRDEIPHCPDRIHLLPQVKFGAYRVDFLIDCGGDRLFAVECDGADFHQDKERDRLRDVSLWRDHKVRVLRAPGAVLWRNNEFAKHVATIVIRGY